MDVSSISSVSPIETSGAPLAGKVGGVSSDSSFSSFVTDLLKDVQGQQQTMNDQVTDLALGKADNLHQVVVGVAETDLMFRMLMEVRDRLVTSYQEIMRMQI
jgi:flagellar hook-basal body complex protein FliE